jgi:basic amino acid/polyamine antiporter, APA family
MSIVKADGERPKLKRSIGLWMAVALVVGNMIGSGVFLLPASLAGTAGPLSILAWVFTGAGAILLALVFANLGRALPRTGGPYAYAREAFGDFAGFWTAWGYWIAAWVGNVAIVTAFVSYGGVFWSPLDSGSGSYSAWAAAIVALSVLWMLTFVNAVGVREAGFVQTVTTVLKFVPLLAIGLIGLFYIHGGNYTPFAPDHHTLWSQFGAISTAGTLTLWAFIGLESATVPAEEVKDPERTLPRATIIGTIAATALYVLATVAIMGIIPAGTLANSSAPFADAARQIWGGSVLGLAPGDLVALIALISTFGCLNGWILLQGRVPLAAAQDGLFPKQFAIVSGKGRTPVVGLVVSSVLMSFLVGMFYSGTHTLGEIFTQVVLLATLTTIVPYAFSAAAQLQLMFRQRELFNPRHLARDAGIAMLAFGYAFWMIWGSGHQTIAQGFLLLLAGIPVYVFMKWRQSLEKPEPLVAPRRRIPDAAREPAAGRIPAHTH